MPGITSITTPPTSATLTTLANAKAELNVTTTADDAYITSLIARASGIIARHCGRPFGVQTITETFRFGWQPGIGPASQSVAPYGTPLQAQFKPLVTAFVPLVATTVSIVENGTTLATDGTDYEVDAPAGLLWRLRATLRSFWGVPVVAVTYKAGYNLPNDSVVSGVDALPPDVESVCLALVAAGYTGRGRDPALQLELTEGVGRTAYQRTNGIGNMTIDEGLAGLLADYCRKAW